MSLFKRLHCRVRGHTQLVGTIRRFVLRAWTPDGLNLCHRCGKGY